MNRLIIVGNGFDLAHGMKTSFNHFITDYYNNAIEEFCRDRTYSDKLLNIKHKQDYGNDLNYFSTSGFSELPKVLEDFKNHMSVDISINSDILRKINESIETKNWVDIEKEYFNLLGKSADSNQIDVGELNEEFDFLKNKLMTYLKKQQDDFSNDFDLSPLVNCFTQLIDYSEFSRVRAKTIVKPESLYFLNFNYTNTCEPYLVECKKKMTASINYIHGNLDGTKGAPIFGFGDEFDKKFLEFEDKDGNEYFKHIKSFDYSKNQNYSSLLSFIESDNFQVHIYGHSCGISDRTMLRSIFESEYCKSIKIFYHGSEEDNDFVERTYEIYRHFSNKGVMRRKVVSLELCEPMPQPKLESAKI
ncbi:hypothetical protein GQR60_02605 [Labilibaculum sp. A4]|uniref:AbiH family protein n=1 Tax=Labilibaculum euxinus TaxID=2686357 RepID=UPI000F620B19|nr:AbiH family protein [Labilibaculum euxinus]MDQ1770561.1 AbiH family protein [Labilibaculum euxinus]MWN75220.1 hypothetical protein [Labilibaculum euxinus]